MRQTYLALKLNFVKGRSYKTYTTQDYKKKHKKEAEAGEEATAEEKQEAPVPLFNHVKNILHSVFSNIEVYINNQQDYNFKILFANNS